MSDFWDSENIVREVPKSGNGESFYRINVVSKDGKKGIDLRVFYEKKDGTIQHTKSGLFINADDVEEIIKWLHEAIAELEES